MAYDLIKQTCPGAPCAIGARVVRTADAREGRIAPPLAGTKGVRVRWDDEHLVRDVDPRELAYKPAERLVPMGADR